MPLNTQTFGISRHWLATAFEIIPTEPGIFSKPNLSKARKGFLAGKNQLDAIKSWLSHAGVIEVRHGGVDLSDLGRLMAARDRSAEKAWTWWMFHLHLCVDANVEEGSAPYSTLFTQVDAEWVNWMTEDAIKDLLTKHLAEMQKPLQRATVSSYLDGVLKSFDSENPLHDLKLLESRRIEDGRSGQLWRRSPADPVDVIVAYGIVLTHALCFRDRTTVEARTLLDRGLGRALGLSEQRFRESLKRIHRDQHLCEFVQYRGAVNLDSVQFVKVGEPALKTLRLRGYTSEEVLWP